MIFIEQTDNRTGNNENISFSLKTHLLPTKAITHAAVKCKFNMILRFKMFLTEKLYIR